MNSHIKEINFPGDRIVQLLSYTVKFMNAMHSELNNSSSNPFREISAVGEESLQGFYASMEMYLSEHSYTSERIDFSYCVSVAGKTKFFPRV